jgi:bifunctional non-homologous end joining protein LigD
VHWVRPQLVAEVSFLAWTDDGLLRQVVYQGLREDKIARTVTRNMPGNPAAASRTAG